MPKFNPRPQQQKRQRRHNPISRAAGGSSDTAPSRRTTTTSNGATTDEAVPILNSLPLPDNTSSSLPPPTLEEDEKVHRALLGLNPLLLAKPTRVALVAPKHKLLQRLLHYIAHHRLEVRREAAGCLRNLCVEGQWSGREQVWALGGGATCLAQIEYAARELGLLAGAKESSGSSDNAPQSTSQPRAPAKKPEDMNRKERRHAAKAAAKAAGAAASAATPNAPAPIPTATPASAAAEADAHDLHLMHLSLLENHLTIVWCLLETVTSPVWLAQLNKSSLGDILCAAIEQGARAEQSQKAAATAAADQREQAQTRTATLEVALTAANLMAAWLEDNPHAAATLAGLPLDLVEQVIAFEQAGNSSEPGTKGRKRLEAIFDRLGNVDGAQARHAAQRVAQLAGAVSSLLSSPPHSQLATSRLDVQRINLALLALASCNNLLGALPTALRSWVRAPPRAGGAGAAGTGPSTRSGPAPRTLAQWQLTTATPMLLELLTANAGGSAGASLWEAVAKAEAAVAAGSKDALQAESGMDVDIQGEDGEGLGDDDEGNDDASHATASLTMQRADVVVLAAELCGEICAEAGTEDVSLRPDDFGADAAGAAEAAQAQVGDDETMGESDGAEGDGDGDGDGDDDGDSLDSEQEAEMLMLAERDREGEGEGEGDDADLDGDMSMEGGAGAAAAAAFPSASRPPPARRGFASTPYASLLTAWDLPSALLSLLPPPGVDTGTGSAGDASLPLSPPPPPSSALSDFTYAVHSSLAALLSHLAAHAQPPPSHPLEQGSGKARRVRDFQAFLSEGDVALRLGAAWRRLKVWAERGLAQPQPQPQPQGDAQRALALALARPVWTSLNALAVMHEGLPCLPFSISAADLQDVFAASLQRFLVAASPEQGAGEPAALVLSTLAYLARAPSCGSGASDEAAPAPLLERNAFLARTALSVLQRTTTGSATPPHAPVPPQAVTAALHALIDTFADESSPWDGAVFVRGGLLPQIKAALPGVREWVRRCVDPRRGGEGALRVREEADEAVAVMGEFVKYRESIA